ncbi:MAG: IS66 family transposase, partial [bacterium]|nr:IS66 family transposase [bacterium]
YDATSASMIGLLKYGSGLPFNRLERLEGNLGIPLPASTQWGIVRDAVGILAVGSDELIRLAAQGDVLYNDDTSTKILQLLKENQRIEQENSKERTGIFTTAIVATCAEHKIAVFLTGRQHAGENLKDVLQHRASELEVPIQMCDGLSRNVPKDFATILANCMSHARRKFVEVVDRFPEECRYVLESLRQVYRHDAIARKEEMPPDRRLRFHQDHSAEIMEALKSWMNEQLDQKKVEPNSALGGALSYMLNRWDKLTLFLRKPGAPLDNNICERALKKAILHRKNALFYKTENGARVGDIFMSLIYTAELSGVNPFDYLTELLKHPEELRRSPREWMPWNYQIAATVADAATARS